MVAVIGQVFPALPSAQAPIADASGRITPAWHRALDGLLVGPQPAQAKTVPASPYTVTASARGSLIVSGGTVSSITLTRGRVTVNLGVVAGMFPASLGDAFVITYTVAPTVTFLPG